MRSRSILGSRLGAYAMALAFHSGFVQFFARPYEAYGSAGSGRFRARFVETG
jgi:hypothetical protein